MRFPRRGPLLAGGHRHVLRYATRSGAVGIRQTANLTTFSVPTNEYRGANGERTEYHACVAWDRLAEICGQFLSKGQLVDVDGRLQTRQWDDDAGKRAQSTVSLSTSRTARAVEPPSAAQPNMDQDRATRGGGTVTEEYASVEMLQKAADRGRQLSTWLNSRQARMTDAERQAYYCSHRPRRSLSAGASLQNVGMHASNRGSALAALALAGLLVACGASPLTSAGPSASAAGLRSETPAPTSDAAPSPPAPAAPESLAPFPGRMGVVVADEPLVVRSLPEISDVSTILPFSLSRGMRFAIDEGPVSASGYAWYRIHVGEIDGWIASGSREGEEAWIAQLENGSIAVAMDAPPDPFAQVVLIEPDGTGSRQVSDFAEPAAARSRGAGIILVVTCGSGIHTAEWSFDGSELLVSRGACATDMHLVPANGSGGTELGPGAMPDWSSDGSRIAYGENVPYIPCGPGCSNEVLGPWEIHIRNADGSSHALTANEAWVGTGNPQWSPDGSSVVFQRGVVNDFEGQPELYIVGSDGAGARLLFHGAGPMWSPDGRFVAATSCCESAHAEAWIVPADARDPSEARMLGVGVPVGWTPDGAAILIAPSGDDPDNAWRLVDRAGNELRRLDVDGSFVDWSPDGQQVLFSRAETSGSTGVYRAALDGTDEHFVVELPLLSGEARALGWQPRLVPIAED